MRGGRRGALVHTPLSIFRTIIDRSPSFFSSLISISASIKRWKALDFASLKRSSISFFNDDKPQTAISRWARARTRAAKVIERRAEREDRLPLRQPISLFFPIFFLVKKLTLDRPPDLQVGKGLSKDEKAQKLALQHWLEAVSANLIRFCCLLRRRSIRNRFHAKSLT